MCALLSIVLEEMVYLNEVYIIYLRAWRRKYKGKYERRIKGPGV